jgi:hypothetical protein
MPTLLTRMRLVIGAVALAFSAEDPEQLRGPQFDAAWCDELAKWPYPDAAFDMLQFGLRLGPRPRQLVTTTPRPCPLIKRLIADPRTAVTRAPTQANATYLAPGFVDEVMARYAGTRLGRQEIDGEIIEERADALWSRGVIEASRSKVDGIKISLLDRRKEIDMRRRLPSGVRMYTGDDFNYPELIEGDGRNSSDALLGIFDAIAPAASAALGRLASGDAKGYREILEPTVPLARHIFRAPTRFYKTGLVFLAWLNGHQEHFVMVGGQQSARSLIDLAETFRLADAAGVLRNPELAVSRMRHFLALRGLDG